MKFSIDSIILWPKRDEFSYRRLPFADGKINIITGLQEPENPPSFQLLTTACVPINARFQLMLFAIPVSGLVFCSI